MNTILLLLNLVVIIAMFCWAWWFNTKYLPKSRHRTLLDRTLDNTKFVFEDESNIDIDEVCEYIRSYYQAESEDDYNDDN